ncbi:MAG TPA: NADH-quinone oxidoreductase subunit C [Chitinophagaceae bacterium]|nr:NADH-quinone oxidoreductase subunit C [Chitinophagaceae bacterium]
MENQDLQLAITEIFPSAIFEEGSEWPTLTIEPDQWLSLAEQIRNQQTLWFDYMFCLTCVDWKTHLTMVYHLSSTKYRHNLVVKAKLDLAKPQIETISHIWRTAEFHEREVYEMFGVNFLHHPDLRLLILPDGWEGKNPLLKNFEDPINMIKL